MAGLALVPTGTYMFMPTLPAMQAHTQIHLSAEPGIRLQQGSHVVAKHSFACFVNVAACSHLLHSCLCGSHGPNLPMWVTWTKSAALCTKTPVLQTSAWSPPLLRFSVAYAQASGSERASSQLQPYT